MRKEYICPLAILIDIEEENELLQISGAIVINYAGDEIISIVVNGHEVKPGDPEWEEFSEKYLGVPAKSGFTSWTDMEVDAW